MWEIRNALDSAAALRVLQRWTEVVYLMGQQWGSPGQEEDVLAGLDLAYAMRAFRSVTMDIIIATLTSAACRLRSNLSLSICTIAVFEVSLSSGVRMSSNKPLDGSSSLLSSFSFPFPWAGSLSRTTIRRGGDSGGRGGVILSCGRLTGEECTTALRVEIRMRPRGKWGDSDMSVLRSDMFGVSARRLPLLGGRGCSELDVEATDDSRGCSTGQSSSSGGG